MNVSKLSEKYYYYSEPIGYGSFSIIYKGYNTHSHNLIAVKQITKIIDKRYFNNEVELMKKLNHPNILKLYDVINLFVDAIASLVISILLSSFG